MIGNVVKAKYILVLAAMAVLASVAFADGTAAPAAPTPASGPVAPVQKDDLSGKPVGGPSGKGAKGVTDVWSYIQTLAALAAVVAVIFALRYGLRKVGAKAGLGGAGRGVEVLWRTTLSPRHQVYLLRLGRRVLLVGAGPGGMSTLSEVTSPEEIDMLLKGQGKSFGAMVESRSAEFARAGQEEQEPGTGDAGSAVKDVTQRIRRMREDQK